MTEHIRPRGKDAETAQIHVDGGVAADRPQLGAAADVNGKWTTTINTMMGEMKWAYTFKVDGEKFAGTTIDNDGKECTIEGGTIKGDEISFVENKNFEGLGPTKIENKGKIVAANEIKFSRVVTAFGATEEFMAKRAQ